MDAQAVEAIALLDKLARTAPIDSLVDLLGELEKVKGIAFARLASSASAPAPVADQGDQLLTDVEAAQMLGLSVEQLRRRRSLPFRRRVGRRTIRYSQRGIQRWLERQRS